MLKALGFIKLAKKEDKEGLPTLSKVLLGAAVGSTIGSPAGRLIAKATKWDPVGKGWILNRFLFKEMYKDLTKTVASTLGGLTGAAIGGVVGGTLGKKATINVDGKSNKNINSSTKPAKVPLTKGTPATQAPNPIKTLKPKKAKMPK